MTLAESELRHFLEEKVEQYNQAGFIEGDPVSIPHLFSLKEDIEIAGFLSASLAWGQRSVAVTNARRLVRLMDYAPYEFITQAGKTDIQLFSTFVHRTFQGIDCMYFIESLQNIYLDSGSLETVFFPVQDTPYTVKDAIIRFRHRFFSLPHPLRTMKHIADPAQQASAKRINMFLRWMVRKDNKGVDLGIWNRINPSVLLCPLDLHVGNVARKLGLLQRKANDWQAVEELTAKLRKFDAGDPVKYDYALFGLGIFEKF